MVDTIFRRVLDEQFGSAGVNNETYLRGLRHAVEASVDYAVRSIGLAQAGEGVVPPVVVAQARRAARVGVGLDTVVRRYIAGMVLLEDVVLQEAEQICPPGDTRPYRVAATTIASLVDRVIATASDAYLKEAGRAARSKAKREDGRTAMAYAQGHAEVIGWAPNGQVHGTQLSSTALLRALDAIVEVVSEHGYAGASVSDICARATVSRATFYKLFGCLDGGLVAIMEHTLARIGLLAARAFEAQPCWRGGMRAALGAVLAFFDSEPQLARVCLVETLGGGPTVLEHRARMVVAFRTVIVEQIETEVPQVSPFAADGMLASVMGIVHAHLIAKDARPLVALLGPLMGTIVRPLADSEQLVDEEVKHGDELAHALQGGMADEAMSALSKERTAISRAVRAATVLAAPRARRQRECLLFIASKPGSSNREIAVGIGVAHRPQISRLLSAMHAAGLIEKHSEGVGKQNSWRLTVHGEQIVDTLGDQRKPSRFAAAP
jgi:AcrR family transcriptional regulator